MYKVVLERRSSYQYIALYVCVSVDGSCIRCRVVKSFGALSGQNLHTKGGQERKEIRPEPPLGVN